MYDLNRDDAAQQKYKDNLDKLLLEYELTEEEAMALHSSDIGLLYVLGVNGQILMH